MRVDEQRNLLLCNGSDHLVSGSVSYLKNWRENQQQSRKATRSTAQTKQTSHSSGTMETSTEHRQETS